MDNVFNYLRLSHNSTENSYAILKLNWSLPSEYNAVQIFISNDGLLTGQTTLNNPPAEQLISAPVKGGKNIIRVDVVACQQENGFIKTQNDTAYGPIYIEHPMFTTYQKIAIEHHNSEHNPSLPPVPKTPYKPTIDKIKIGLGTVYVEYHHNGGPSGVSRFHVNLKSIGNRDYTRTDIVNIQKNFHTFNNVIGGNTYQLDLGVDRSNFFLGIELSLHVSEHDSIRFKVPKSHGMLTSGRWYNYTNKANAIPLQPDAMAVNSRNSAHIDLFWIENGSIVSRYFDPAIYHSANAHSNEKIQLMNLNSWSQDFFIAKNANAHSTGPITALSRKPDTVEVFWATQDSTLNFAFWYPKDGWRLANLAPANSIAKGSGMTSISREKNHMEVFWISPNGSIQYAWWYNDLDWTLGQLKGPNSAATQGCIVSCSRSHEAMECFWITPSGNIDHAYWTAKSKWKFGSLQIPQSNKPALNERLSVMSRHEDTMELFWVDQHGDLCSAYWYSDKGWKYQVIKTNRKFSNRSISSISRKKETMEVFVFERSGSLNTVYLDKKLWKVATISTSPTETDTNNLAIGAVSKHKNTIEVLYYRKTKKSIDGAFINF